MIGVLVVLLFTVPISIYLFFLPGQQSVNFNPNENPALIIGDQVLYEPGIVYKEETVFFSLKLFLEEVDSKASWNEEEKILTITTVDKLIRMNTEQLTTYINRQPLELSFPLQEIEENFYISLDFLLSFYPIEIGYARENNVVILDREETKPLPAEPLKSFRLRQKMSSRSPFYRLIEEEEKLLVFSEEDGWYRVRTKDGIIGYASKKDVGLKGAITLEKAEVDYPRQTPWKPAGEKINLTWEFAYNRPEPYSIPPMPGVNVVSPTWFHLNDEEGNLRNIANPLYVTWAHEQGYQVWALVTNNFDKELTHQVLKSPSKRQKVIDQLLSFAALYEFDGINIDFENMYYEDRDLLTQFVRELTPLAHEQGLTVSIDVTIKSTSRNWSMIYDRKALAEVVDYVALMTYDEHWAASPVAGSVASLPWVEAGLKGVLEEVPPEKLLLGIPFYTRLWKEEMLPGGGSNVSSNAYSMGRIREILEAQDVTLVWDHQAQQNYAEYTEDDIVYKVWLEDEESIRRRVDLVDKYNLAGVATWRRGFEDPEIWDIIAAGLEGRP